MSNIYRVPIAALDARNENIDCQYAADAAAWIWHPDKCEMVEFELEWL